MARRQYYIYAFVSEREKQIVERKAKALGLSQSAYVRLCVGGALLEEDPDGPTLEDTPARRGRSTDVSEAR